MRITVKVNNIIMMFLILKWMEDARNISGVFHPKVEHCDHAVSTSWYIATEWLEHCD